VPGQRFANRFEAEFDIHRNRHAPGQNPSAEPVDHRRQIDKAARHRDVGDVHRPHLVRSLNRQTTQKIRIDLVPRRRLRCVRPTIQRLDAHAPHHRGHVLPPDHHSFPAQQVTQHPAARERIVQMQRVDPSHDRQIGRRHRSGLIV
jgi:hypothetical protein